MNSTLKTTALAAVALTAACSGGGGSGSSDTAVALSVRTAVPGLGLTTLDDAIEAGGVGTDLDTAPALTLFAPDDPAFAALPPGVLDDLLLPANQSRLRTLLTYHTVAGQLSLEMLRTVALTDPPILSTRSNARLVINEIGGELFVNDARVIRPDSDASNGTIHVIDRVLMPTEDLYMTLVARGFSRFTEGIEAAGLVTDFSSAGSITVLAPTDAAIEDMGAGMFDALLQDVPALTEFIDRHRVEGTSYASDLIAQGFHDTLAGERISFEFQNGDLTVNDDPLESFNIPALNGVIHVLDRPLVARNTFELIGDLGLQDLEFAMLTAGVDEPLSNLSAVTVFAPIDQAFADLPTSMPGDPLELNAFLDTTWTNERTRFADLPFDSVVINESGTPLLIFEIGTKTYVNDALIISTDHAAANGIVHVIDRVLLPFENLFDSLTTRGLTDIAEMIVAAGLQAELASDGQFTLFAPTNAALAALPGTTDPGQLIDHHLLDGVLPAWTTTRVESSTISRDGFEHDFLELDSDLTIDGFVLETINIPCTNGVLYVIDTVLPSTSLLTAALGGESPAEARRRAQGTMPRMGAIAATAPRLAREHRQYSRGLPGVERAQARRASRSLAPVRRGVSVLELLDVGFAPRMSIFTGSREPLLATPGLESARLVPVDAGFELNFESAGASLALIEVLSSGPVRLPGAAQIDELDPVGDLSATRFAVPLDDTFTTLVIEGGTPRLLELVLLD